MDNSWFFTAELARLERQWIQDSDVAAATEAVLLCGLNAWPLPEWVLPILFDALDLLDTGKVIREQGKKAQGLGGTSFEKRAQRAKDMRRYAKVEWILLSSRIDGQKLTLEAAYKLAADELKGECVTPRTIMASYRRIKKSKTAKTDF